MANAQDSEAAVDEDYDEEADSDFHADAADPEDSNSASEDEERTSDGTTQRPRKRRKVEKAQDSLIAELDSGDEATIKEQKHSRRRRHKKKDGPSVESENESDGWRARTRAMRTREKEEHKKNSLASCKGSTIDVDKIWEEMNRPAPLAPPHMETEAPALVKPLSEPKSSKERTSLEGDGNKENEPAASVEETVTIKRTYKFAGEVHVEEKTVPRSSAEAQLWLSQQQSAKPATPGPDGKIVNRPLRKISRFDPNLSNLGAFKAAWAAKDITGTGFKGPKLNVVEKSKMDWAAHVDTEGLKEELDTHAKAKEGYLNRMDFLKDVEERREAEARAARLKGH
ncbi:hypothetical protein A1O1_04222 [Capronia coronata CBS 617.96]|uniref:SWR1-complex protein 5 n=1 Tax=Capronia coronata CBS 617.96 TaxID=1182541 RepID=W9YN55_9EURO|nr:uncharacterized protein A1O1_04222 [Capronia coronata CBS 617.96]EXJ91115.1 hypothetical protein A1O1_04222 [Capronia coronata CBS 617.96]